MSDPDEQAESSEAMFARRSGETNAPTSAETAPSSTALPEIPDRIGAYRVLGVIGRGGMGTVYRAEQQSPRRIIALKTISGLAASAELRRRFERESNVLAQLKHSGIAQVYESGVANGVPFFAMEMVEGQSLTSYVRRKSLGMRDRLDLMARVCEAMEYAHEHGVIHRDLKPDNILVNESGEPKILDFGIARATNRDLEVTTVQTNVGQVLGTIPYMSPEQISGDPVAVDERTDVYALGVIAYQLLADRLPLDVSGKTLAQAARVIEDEEPAPLSSVRRHYRGDAETIILKALEKDRSRRYQSVHELREDLERFLANRPIQARPPSTWYQLRKFSRRHKALVGGVSGVIVALAAGLVATTLALAQAQVAQREAERQGSIAQAVNEFLIDDLLSAVDPGELGIDVSMREVLDEASRRIAGATEPGGRFALAPEVAAAVHETIGETFLGLGAFEPAEVHLRRSVELFTEAVGAEDLRAQEPRIGLAEVYWRQFRAEEAAQHLEPAVDVLVRELGPNDRQTLVARMNLANQYKYQDRLDEAEAIYLDVLERMQRVLGMADEETLTCRFNHALLELNRGDLERATELMQSIVDDRERVMGPDHLQTINAAGELASMHARAGAFAEAEPLLERVLESQRSLLGDSHWRTLETMANVATIHYLQDKYDEAQPIYDEALAGYREVRGPADPGTLTVTTYAALSHEKAGRLNDAAMLLVRAFEDLGEEGTQDETAMSDRACKIAELLTSAGEVERASIWAARCTPSQSDQ